MRTAEALLILLALTLLLPLCPHARQQPCSLSFHLLLPPPPPSIPHAAAPTAPLTGPHVFLDAPLLGVGAEGLAYLPLGTAGGFYLASASDASQVGYLFFTAYLQGYRDDEQGDEALTGTISFVGSAPGALSIVGGTGDFAFAAGETKVAMVPAQSSSAMAVSFQLQLLYRHLAPEHVQVAVS